MNNIISKIKSWLKANFTINSLKASLPVWKKVFTDMWNLIMFAGLILACVEGFKHDPYTGLGFVFFSTWLVIHRYIIALKKMQLNELSKLGSGPAPN